MRRRAALAQSLVSQLDRIANLIERHASSLQIPDKAALDFAYRCDLISDSLDKTADFDPKEVGMEVSGPMTGDPDELGSFLDEHFTQQSFRELSDLQTGGDLGEDVTLEPRGPEVGRQARRLTRTRQGSKGF